MSPPPASEERPDAPVIHSGVNWDGSVISDVSSTSPASEVTYPEYIPADSYPQYGPGVSQSYRPRPPLTGMLKAYIIIFALVSLLSFALITTNIEFLFIIGNLVLLYYLSKYSNRARIFLIVLMSLDLLSFFLVGSLNTFALLLRLFGLYTLLFHQPTVNNFKMQKQLQNNPGLVPPVIYQ